MRALSMMMRAFVFLSIVAVAALARAEPQLAEQEAAKAYDKARACYTDLMLNEKKQAQRGNWEKCIAQFAAVARDYDETAKGPDALYTQAKLYRLLGQNSHNKEDAAEAYDLYANFTKRYKKNRLYDDALYEMAAIKLYTFGDDGKAKRLLTTIIRWDPDGDRVRDAKNLLADIRAGKVKAPAPASLKPQGALLSNRPKSVETLPTAPAAEPSAVTEPPVPAPAEKKTPAHSK